MLAGHIPVFNRGKYVAVPTGGYNDSFTKLLMHFDYAAIAPQTYIDGALGNAAAHIFTQRGASLQHSSAAKFGPSGYASNNPGDWIDTPANTDLDLGAGDWCIDFWLNCFTGATVQSSVFGKCATGLTDGYYCYVNTGGALLFALNRADGTVLSMSSGTTPFSAGGQHHVAIERYGNTITMYIDGVALNAVPLTQAVKAAPYKFAIGALGEWGANINLNGHIDEFRVSIGTARFKGNFPLPVKAYEVPATTGNDQFTKALLHFDGGNGSTTITDSNAGGAAHAWTNHAGSITTADSKFGGASYNNGAQVGWVDTPDSADFHVAALNFAVDFWFKYEGVIPAGASLRLFGQDTSAGTDRSISGSTNNSSKIVGTYTTNGSTGVDLAGATTIAAGWHHYAFVRSGSNLYLFLDGVMDAYAQISGAIWNSSGKFAVGEIGERVGGMWNGKLDEFRLSVGTPRWTGNFVPPTVPYS